MRQDVARADLAGVGLVSACPDFSIVADFIVVMAMKIVVMFMLFSLTCGHNVAT